nr:acid phosphatase/vanadium-dependent haloperoxidas proteine-related [Tanacetum cinerariifolium]
TDFVTSYVRLLRDNKAEVHIASAGKVTKFSYPWSRTCNSAYSTMCQGVVFIFVSACDLNRSFIPIFTACNCGTGLRQTMENYMICRYKEHRWDLEQLIGSGGMSPSHSATVTALAGALGLHDSLDGSTFATALILACIV